MVSWDDGGWLYIGAGDANEMIIRCKKVDYDWEDKSATFIDFPSDGHYAFSLQTYGRPLRVTGIFFTTTADKDTFLLRLNTLQTAGAYNLKLETNTTSSFAKWDGENTTFPVLFAKVRGIEKTIGGNAEFWEIKQIVFKQAGALTE